MSNHEVEIGDEITWSDQGVLYRARMLGLSNFNSYDYYVQYSNGWMTAWVHLPPGSNATLVSKKSPKIDTSTPYVRPVKAGDPVLTAARDTVALGFNQQMRKALDEVDRALYRTRQVSIEDVAAQYPDYPTPVCDCGAVKAQTSHANWCSTVERTEK